MTLGRRPGWIEDETAVDWHYYQLFGSQVAGVSWELETRPDAAPNRYGLLIGASTIQRGPLPQRMRESLGFPWLLLGVGGGTRGFAKLLRSVERQGVSRLEPGVIVLGIHPIWICEPPRRAVPPPEPGPLWALRERKKISNRIYGSLQDLREQLIGSVGHDYAVYRPALHPWEPSPESPRDQPLPDAQISRHRERSEAAGRFAAANYPADSPMLHNMVRVVKELVRVQPKLLVALMPEREAYRSRVPKVAKRLVLDTLERELGESGAGVVDLSGAIEDELFWDNYHLTMVGRRVLSDRLSEVVRSRFPLSVPPQRDFATEVPPTAL